MESLERDLHCPVCLDVYTKPVLMLPCQHNLCRQCVQNIVYTQDEDDEGYRGGPGRPSAFPCPQCRQCTYLGRRGIDGLKRNILVENIVDSYREVAAQIKKKVVCAEHEDERPSLYCSSHEKAICALCKLVGEHKECEVQELKNVLAEKKGMLQGKMQLLEDRSNLLDRFIQENKTLSKSVEDKCSQHKDMVRRETLALFSIISKRQSTLYDKLEVEKEEKLASLSGQVTRCEEEKGRVAALVRDAEVLMKEEEPTRFVEAANEMAERLTLGAESEELTPCVDEEFEHCLVDFKEAQDMLKKLDFVEGASGRTSPDRQPCPGPNCSAYGDSVYNNLCSKCYRVLTAANSGTQTDQDGKKNTQTQDAPGQPSSAAQQTTSQTCPTSPDRQSQWSYNSQSPGGSPARGRGRRNSGGRGPSLYYCNCPQCAGVQFQLDWMSAPQCLRLSNYNTTITHMPNRGHQPFGPHHVLADISVNSGRIYWEVFVGNSRGFRVGVTYDRDYPAREFLGGNNYSWALRYDYMCTLDGVIRFQAIHDCREVVVEVDTLPRSLGVLLDYDRGRLSCYNVGRGHIFTFFCSFREPIVPAFDVWKGSINIRTGLPPNSL
ncbi:tripartite motif-containing protein 54-like isoform X1 [Branchiostoma floridae]|uniref:Tripartite motif-containing protein 54-like isoform X1 n=1 Tax=Branchiostoma floridae TaxID=7739 RepID=A0A9J7LSV8_BRAFL|nr:tripartite motif-containing protein 54-like isoform X1 [Branchiostoma floridae]